MCRLDDYEQQARIAAFAMARVEAYEVVIASAAELSRAAHPVPVIYQHRERPEATTTKLLSAGIIATHDDYADYLRTVNSRTDPNIAGRVALLSEYGRFAPAVASHIATLPPSDKQWHAHPSYLGEGACVVALRVEHETEQYALRIPKSDPEEEIPPAAIIDSYAEAFVHGIGVPHLEQGVAYSLREAKILSQIAPGLPTYKVSTEQLDTVNAQHINELYDTFEEMQRRELAIDESAGNLLYDPQCGFTAIDYYYHPASRGGQSFGEKPFGLIEELGARRFELPEADTLAWIGVANDKLQLLYDITAQRYPREQHLPSRISNVLMQNLMFAEQLRNN